MMNICELQNTDISIFTFEYTIFKKVIVVKRFLLIHFTILIKRFLLILLIHSDKM